MEGVCELACPLLGDDDVMFDKLFIDDRVASVADNATTTRTTPTSQQA